MLFEEDALASVPSPTPHPGRSGVSTSKGTSMRPAPHRSAFRIRGWILRNIVADDPHPVPSSLDRWDHQGSPPPVSPAPQQRPATSKVSRIRIFPDVTKTAQT